MKLQIQAKKALHKTAVFLLLVIITLAMTLTAAAAGNVEVTKEWKDGRTGQDAANREAPKVTVHATVTREEVLDLYYPVGTFYETADASFDPNSEWGGTWEKVEDGRVLISANATYAVGATGGEASHILTPTETAMKEHSHTVNSHNHSIPGLSGTAASAGSHMHHVQRNVNAQNGTNRYTANGGGSSTWTVNGAGTHSHSVTMNGSTTGGSSPGTSSTTAANGSAHNNMQPYTAVNRWHRTA